METFKQGLCTVYGYTSQLYLLGFQSIVGYLFKKKKSTQEYGEDALKCQC